MGVGILLAGLAN